VKTPRDIDARELIKILEKLGYIVTRQKGSHIRLTKTIATGEYHLTVPNHSPIKIGTMNNILNDVSSALEISKEELLKLFNR
jgi:predicted RNA binding protein YcfA (HicA-like mRNA interferase family)